MTPRGPCQPLPCWDPEILGFSFLCPGRSCFLSGAPPGSLLGTPRLPPTSAPQGSGALRAHGSWVGIAAPCRALVLRWAGAAGSGAFTPVATASLPLPWPQDGLREVEASWCPREDGKN